MASSLAAQLQKITATSTNTLNTQKLKQIHSASLLFPETHAASQDLETIYSIATEGFRELCQLDERYIAYERGLFSDSSKAVDRFLLPRNEVDELDRSIEGFLQLVSGKLLLRPALKAVEWLVRRFRVQEQNTAAVLLCFLPYHSHPTLFPTLLGIIPQKNIPREFLFLTPYIKPAAPVPRHVITHALSHRRDFFTLLSEYVTSVVRTRRDNHALLSFYSAVATESVSLMCDASRKSGGITEDVLHRTMSILEEGYKARKSSEFQIGCYMLTTVLVSKLSLSGQLLLSLMQGVVAGWTKDSLNAGLACLAFLAQARQGEKEVRISDEITKGLLKIDNIAERLLAMGEKYRVDKLVVGLCLGVLDRLGRKHGVKELSATIKLLEEARMGPKQRRLIMKKLVSAAQQIGAGQQLTAESETDALENIKETLATSLVRWSGLGEKKKLGKLIRDVLEDDQVDVELLELKLQTVIRPAQITAEAPENAPKAIEAAPVQPAESFDAILTSLPESVEGDSFLAPTPPAVLERLSQAFLTSITSSAEFTPVFSLPLFKGKSADNALSLSLLIRIWTSPRYPALARTIALKQAAVFLKATKERVDFQALIPHILAALTDPAQNVRREAAALMVILSAQYKTLGGDSRKAKKKRKSEGKTDEPTKYWGLDTIYGQGKETEDIKWLETSEASRVLEEIVGGKLEECILDSHVIGHALGRALSVKSAADPEKTGLKSAMKTSAMAFLGSHAVNVPGLLVKQRLLSMLNRVEKASTSRTKFLLPALVEWTSVEDYATRVAQCVEERLDIVALEKQLVGVVSEGSSSVDALVEVIDKGLSDTLRTAAAARITKIWDTLSGETKITVAESLLEIALEGEDAGDAVQVLRDVTLSTEVFDRFLEKSRAQLKAALPGGGVVAKSKRQRTSINIAAQTGNEEDQAVALRGITIVSELVEAQGAEKHPDLLKSLFGVLGDVGNMEYAGIAYLHGVLLSCMGAIIKSYKGSKSVNLDSSVRADVLVNTIRSTSSPQVQNSALLLLAALADVAPDVVKHSVMPIFTFMGANTLRQDDEYSAHVIEQTIQRIIPPLVKSLQEQGSSPVVGAAELITTFVASYKHIPVHRRVRLFVALAETLGVDEFLFTLLAKLSERYKVAAVTSHIKGADDIGEFCAMLAGSFGAETQLLNVVKYLNVVLDVLEPSPDGLAKHLFEEAKDTRPLDLAGRLLQVLAEVLRGDNLRIRSTRALKTESADAAKLRAYFSDAMEKTLALGETYQNTEIAGEISTVLEHLLDLLSTPQFVDVVETLIDRPESKFRRSALKTFKDRVTSEARTNATSRSAVLKLMPKIAAIVSGESPNELKADALSCIDAVTIKYGKQEPSIIAKLADYVISSGGLRSTDVGLRVLSLVCLTSMTSCLGGRIVPVLPKTVPFALEQLQASLDDDDLQQTADNADDEPQQMIHNSVLAFFDELVRAVPSFMTSYLLKLLPLVYRSRGASVILGNTAEVISKELLKSIATNMDAKTVMGVLLKTWGGIMEQGDNFAVSDVLTTVEDIIDNATKSTVQKMHSSLLQFLLLAFDIRRTSNFAPDMLALLEQRNAAVTLKIVYKLNDTIFKPMFLRMLEWAAEDLRDSDPKGRTLRLIMFWQVLTVLTDNLKSLVTEYYGYVLENAVEIVGKGIEDGCGGELWDAVVQCLGDGFATDERDFWQSPAHFDKIAPVLLSSLNGATAKLATRAIVELANAAQSEDHFKFINMQVLQHMRSEDADVRLAAVETMTALYAKLGEEWLPLLPESVPFIAELMEDDEEDVERAVQRLIVKVEEFLGAGELEAMLT